MDINNISIFKIGEWKAEQVSIHVLTQKRNIKLYRKDKEAIEKKWAAIKKQKPSITPGPTVRLTGCHSIGEDLILEVVGTDYKEAQVLGKLGIAMVPVTKDNYIVLQGPSKDPDHMYGECLRPPGCTPTDQRIFKKIVEEMDEEFGARISKNDIIALGLTHVEPPAGPMPEFCLVVRIDYQGNFEELRASWEIAKDKNEGEPVRLRLKLDKGRVALENWDGDPHIRYAACAQLLMVINSKLKKMNLSKYNWYDKLNVLEGLKL